MDVGNDFQILTFGLLDDWRSKIKKVPVQSWDLQVIITKSCLECDGANQICVAILIAEISMISWFEQFWTDGTSKCHWIDIWMLVVCIVKSVWGTLFDYRVLNLGL